MSGEETGRNFLELFYELIFHPREGFRAAADNPPYGGAVGLVLGIYLLDFLADASTGAMDFLGLTRDIWVLFGLSGMVIVAVAWFMQAAVVHFLAGVFGGQGQAGVIFCLLGLAGAPLIFLPPVKLLVAAAKLSGILVTAASVSLAAWAVVLAVLAVKETYRFTFGRAAAVVLIPGVALFLATVLVLLLLGKAVLPNLPFG